MNKTLYLCYFGVREPLVQTQVLPYLREIKKMDGIKVHLLTFEPNLKTKWTAEQIETERVKLAAENIVWHFLPYHKRPSIPATFYDILNGARFAINLSRREKVDVLHARAHIPMLMALFARKFINCQTIFDIRGMMADEYADADIWQENSKPFRFVKYIERKGIEKASQIVVLTAKFRDYLINNNLKKSENIEVIPCCVDFSRIKNVNNDSKKRERFELIYAGSVTGLYLLRDMGRFFLELKKHKPNAFFRILTVSPQDVSKIFDELQISRNDYATAKVSVGEVPEYLKQAHLGISFRKATFSQIASSPTKIPEYLACGLPVVSNYGIGDTDALLEGEKVGVCLKTFDQNEISEASEEVLKLLDEDKIEEKCVKVAHKYFDLASVGRNGYQNVYRRLVANKS